MTTPVELQAAFGIAAAAFLLGTAIPVALLVSLPASKDRTRLAGLSLITAVPMVTYAAAALGIGTTVVGGDTFYPTRYLAWLVTTPLLIGYVGYVAGASRTTTAAMMAADAAMILAGAAAVLAGGTLQWTLFGVGSLFHLVLLVGLYAVIPRTVSDDPGRQGFFTLLQHHVGALWLAYPMVWALSPVGIGAITLVGTGLIVAFLDVIAKVPYVYFFYARRDTFGARETEAETGGEGTPEAQPAD